jgi:hypothetical protein
MKSINKKTERCLILVKQRSDRINSLYFLTNVFLILPFEVMISTK